MIVTDDRTVLDEHLEDGFFTILLLVGKEDSDASLLHDEIEGMDREEWHVCFLITDPTILDATHEWQYWFDKETENRWGVLGGDDNDLVDWGETDFLFLPDSDEPDFLRIRGVFATGDMA